MRIQVDEERCEGHGFCEEQAPELFELDDDGLLIQHYDGRDVPAEFETEGRTAAGVCPVAALRVMN